MQISFIPVCNYHLNFSRPHLPLAIDRIMEKQWLKRFGHASPATWKSPAPPIQDSPWDSHRYIQTSPHMLGLQQLWSVTILEHGGTVLSPWQTHCRGFWKPLLNPSLFCTCPSGWAGLGWWGLITQYLFSEYCSCHCISSSCLTLSSLRTTD